MASIKCKACGRRYSYHESDLCPHCGAYNRPSSRMRVDFDKDGNAELLHEQTFLQQSAAGRQRKDCYERKECHEGAARQVRIPGLNNQQLMEKNEGIRQSDGSVVWRKGREKEGWIGNWVCSYHRRCHNVAAGLRVLHMIRKGEHNGEYQV